MLLHVEGLPWAAVSSKSGWSSISEMKLERGGFFPIALYLLAGILH